jgi:hypothetical protein
VLDPALLHDSKPWNPTELLNYPMSDRTVTGFGLLAAGTDPVAQTALVDSLIM